jgi:DNA repair ATPase RecN
VLERIEAVDFQSLRSVEVRLGGLTVVRGASNSGKTALIRALRVLVLGGRGTGYVTRGRKTATVRAEFSDGDVQTERGALNTYELAFPDRPPQVYTKLAGQIPEDVAKHLRLDELNIAAQFDRPYLLTETGSGVARVLGALTNVGLLLAAAQEANRRRGRALATLRGKAGELAHLRERLADFADLPQAIQRAQAAEEALAQVDRESARVQALRSLIEALRAAQGVVVEHRRLLPEVPDISAVEELAQQYARKRAVFAEAWTAQQAEDRVLSVMGEVVSTASLARQEFSDALAAAEVCPLCGGSTIERAGV